MFTNSYIQAFNTFTIIGLTPQSTLKPINDTRSNIFENAIFEMKVVTWSDLVLFLNTIGS